MSAVVRSDPQAQRPTEEKTSRVTKEGRRITYNLKVIQQPERARACGSGAKSSADRRPVDPPPVVELRIYEGEEGKKEDITFGYTANFFLFATLEVARPMAHGRLQPAPQNQVPVLTGMPVSGMAYLDRPTEAGYFIFPDLSVRHEGRYKLSFNLYEETKNPGDANAESPSELTKPKIPSGPGDPDSSFDWRLEVKSREFHVYSAKKFPGLAESTPLSRTVAEQGCRVRIRRDVRMRRREEKPTYDEIDGYARRPEDAGYVDRGPSRSVSHSPARSEGSAVNGQYPLSQAPGHQQGNTLGWLQSNNSGQATFAHPQFGGQQQPPAPQPYQPAPQPYLQQSPQYRPAPLPAHNNHTYSTPHDRQPHPHSAYPSNPPREARPFYEPPESRRSSMAGPYPTQNHHYPIVESTYNNRSTYYPPRARSPPPMHSHISLPPLEMALEKFEGPSAQPGPLPSVSRITQPPLSSPAYPQSQDHQPYSQYSAPAAQPRNGKRAFDNAFSSSSTTKPLYNGMRPDSKQAYDDEEESTEMSLERMKMMYKRADGTSFSRELPTLE